MESYSLNKLISKLSKEICDMDMYGFDRNNDDHWTGYIEFQIDFKDCIVVIFCLVSKSFNFDDELLGREVVIDNIYLQYEIDKKPLSIEDIRIIEEKLKI